MKRTPLKRSTKPIKRTRIRPKKRKPSEFARIYGSKARVEFVKSLRCAVSVACESPSENAHIVSGGMGRKADYTSIIPLCHTHHGLLHQHGRQSFEIVYDFDLASCARATENLWAASLDNPADVLTSRTLKETK